MTSFPQQEPLKTIFDTLESTRIVFTQVFPGLNMFLFTLFKQATILDGIKREMTPPPSPNHAIFSIIETGGKG